MTVEGATVAGPSGEELARSLAAHGIADHPAGVGDFTGRVQSVAFDYGSDQTVVGQNEILALFAFDNDRLARRADAGINDRNENSSGRIIGRDSGQETARFLDRIRRDLVGDVHDARVRCDTHHDRTADGRRVIGRSEVRHKHNDRVRIARGSG